MKKIWKIHILLLLLPGSALVAQMPWNAVGPAGGDARSFAAVPGNPSHLYLGTTNSWLYESTDRGNSWRRLAKLGASDDLILDHIVVDEASSSTIYVAAWTVTNPDGGLWISHDSGKSWTESAGMHGQSIRAFAQAPSNPRTLIAGTLEGVFRSRNAGATWQQISPPASQEIHEIESLAIDPVDPNIVYAGTWHLPWKTTDGGENWHNIKQGIIEDSDVFSIIIDSLQTSVVYASACSGIYKSENGAELFKKIPGIPSAARRTRVLKQDPLNHDVVYAGTTEGLYKSVDAGKTFAPMTRPDTIVNDVFVDPIDSNRVLLATDRGGVLSSDDGAATFVAANNGFSGRKVEALLVDNANPAHLFAGVLNDKNYGGAFVSSNGGSSWEQIADGLGGRDVYTLAQSPDGVVLAGTNNGIFMLAEGTTAGPGLGWAPLDTSPKPRVVSAVPTPKRKGKIPPAKGLARRSAVHKVAFSKANSHSRVSHKPVVHKSSVRKNVAEQPAFLSPPGTPDSRVYALDLSGDAWFAATAAGILTSRDRGATWQGGPVLGSKEYISGTVHGALIVAARRDGLALSSDAGRTWDSIGPPSAVSLIHRVAFTPNGTLWLAAHEGIYLSHDEGKTWRTIDRFPMSNVDDVYYDAQMQRVLVSSRDRDWVFAIDPAALSWTWSRTGYRVFLVRAAAGRMVAASLYDGVLLAPQPEIARAGAQTASTP